MMTSRPPKRHQREADEKREESAVERKQHFEQEKADVIAQMGTDLGRRNAYRMLTRAGLIFGDAAVSENLLNPTITFMTAACARRQVAWRFDHIVRRHCNPLWLQMLEENKA